MCDTIGGAGRSASGPRWGRLYALTLAPLAVLAALEAMPLSPPLHSLTRSALTLATFLAMAWWADDNRAAFDLQAWCSCAPRTVTVRVIASHSPEAPAAFEIPLGEAQELVTARDERSA